MRRTYNFLIFLAVISAALFFGACRKDKITEDETITGPGPVVLIEAGVIGLVTDETGSPLSGADVYLGSKHTQTDEYGYFQLESILNAALPFVRVEKAGYFPSLAGFSAKAGKSGRVKVMLQTKSPAAQLNASSGGTVTVPGGGKVVFAPNGFVDATGQQYDGTVMVFATYLDPTAPNIDHLIPGGFLGRSTAGENQILTSFGMVHMLLETPSGQKIQINKPAEVTMPIPADRVSKAPASIPLWYIDEATGYWKEEGSASLQGNAYVGSVTHFSWWNCDIGSGYVRMSGQIRLGSEHPFVTLRVTQNGGLSATTTPDESGYFSGGVPANQTFLFEVLDECGNVVYSATLGPFGSETDIGIIAIPPSANNWITVQGSLENCDQQPVTNGFVSFRTNGNTSPYFPVPVDPATGTFSGAVVNCGGTEITLTAFDLDEHLSSDPVTLPITQDVDFGTVPVCDNAILAGITMEFPNGTKKFIPITSAVLQQDTVGTDYYQFLAYEDQGGGNTVEYSVSLVNWTGNPNNPNWAMATHFTIFGNPTYYDMETNNIEALALGTQPGEQVILRLTDVILSEKPAGIHYANCTVTISAILQ